MATTVYFQNRINSLAFLASKFFLICATISPPDLSHMQVYLSQCGYVVIKNKVRKLDAIPRESLIMGYSYPE